MATRRYFDRLAGSRRNQALILAPASPMFAPEPFGRAVQPGSSVPAARLTPDIKAAPVQAPSTTAAPPTLARKPRTTTSDGPASSALVPDAPSFGAAASASSTAVPRLPSNPPSAQATSSPGILPRHGYARWNSLEPAASPVRDAGTLDLIADAAAPPPNASNPSSHDPPKAARANGPARVWLAPILPPPDPAAVLPPPGSSAVSATRLRSAQNGSAAAFVALPPPASAPSSVHIGVVEVRMAAPPPIPQITAPQTTAVPAPSLARGFGWRYGLGQS